MEPHQKKYIKPADLLFADRINSDGFAPPDDCVKDVNTLDATHDNITATGATEQVKQAAPIRDPRLEHPFYVGLLLARATNGETTFPHVSKHNIIYPDMLKDTTKAVSTHLKAPESGHVLVPTIISPGGLPTESHHLGTLLHTYQNTTSEEFKQVIGCLVNLDMAITQQTHLNELHEAHTAKNFREQRHLNKDRKLRLRETVRSTNEKLTSLDAQRMGQDIIIKQHEIRANSHQHQLKGLQERVQMLAQGGEWAETEVNELKQTLADAQGQVKSLELSNVGMIDQVWSLKEEVHALREKEKVWERRLAALERTAKDQNKSQLMDVCVKKEQVLNAASSAVGNGRIFSIRL